MKVKSSALFGLMVVICSISGFSLLKRFTQEVDEWRPSNLYSSTNLTRRSTFSVVSSAPASYTEAVATISSGSESMFAHGGAVLYAPVSAPTYGLSPLASSPSGGLYTTSSAELRSFGGGGNGGGVSMSGGSVKSSGPSMASAGLGVSMPSTSVFAYNTKRNNSTASDVMSSIPGDVAMASTQAYAGIGNTTGGASRGISGRKNGSVEDSWLQWLALYGTKYGTQTGDEENGYIYSFDYYDLYDAYMDYIENYWNDMWGGDNKPTFEQWLSWFQGGDGSHGYRGNTYTWVPIGDYYPLLILAMLYVGYVAIRRRKSKISENNI